MLTVLAQDTMHDITLFQSFHSGPDYHVRYGLEVTHHEDIEDALDHYRGCLRHAIS